MTEEIIKYYQGELTEAESASLLKAAYANPPLKKQMIEYQHLHCLIALSPEMIDVGLGAVRYALFMKRIRKQSNKRILFPFLRYAAIAVLLIGVIWMISFPYPAAPPIATQQELYVPPGQRARITLPDGSKVWLNAGSTLSYASVFGKERRVFLSGEAFFEVAKDENSPFIVSANSINIKALGTQFNVFSYPNADSMSVYLLEGSIKAYDATDEAKGIVLVPRQRLIRQNRQNGHFRIEMVQPTSLLWREGIYVFEKQRLGNILKQLELYYDIKIIVNDPHILNYEYTGKFRQLDGVMEILRVIQHIHKFQISKDEKLNQIVLTR